MFSYFEVTDTAMDKYRLQLINGFWNKQEVVNTTNMRHDIEHIKNLPEKERMYILQILSFFASGDDEVIDIIYKHLLPKVTCASWRGYEIIKQANEHIHSETYAGLIDYLAPESKEKLLKGVGEYEFVHDKIKWCRQFLAGDPSLERVILCLLLVEQLYFSSSFCSIFWYKEIRGILPCVAQSNELISRDEGHHYRVGKYLFLKYRKELTNEEIIQTISSAVEIEKKFVRTITPSAQGMNPDLLCQYVEFVADNICFDLCETKIYNSLNPFGFMLQFGIERKVDNFMRKSTNYSAFVVEEFIPEN